MNGNKEATMKGHVNAQHDAPVRRRHRLLLGVEPIFEGGWLHKGLRAHDWDVEDRLTAVSLLGDVTVDLAESRSTPAEVTIGAYALLRDVDVVVAKGTRVELSGRARNGHLSNDTPQRQDDEDSERVARIHGHTLLGDVNVRVAE